MTVKQNSSDLSGLSFQWLLGGEQCDQLVVDVRQLELFHRGRSRRIGKMVR